MAISLQKRKSRYRRRLETTTTTAIGVELENFNDNEYVGSIGVGSPPQYLTVVFDTGSSDFWIPDSTCTTCGKHDKFDAELSSTFERELDSNSEIVSFRISYGSGDVAGSVGVDEIRLANLTIPDIRFGLASLEDSAISGFDMDGICGLAFDGLALITKPSVVDAMMSSASASLLNLSSSFSMYLGADPNNDERPSQIMFGSYDLSIVGDDAEFYYTPLVRDGNYFTYWTIQLSGFEITSSSSLEEAFDSVIQFSVCNYETSCLAIVDSGTSGIAIPTSYYESIVAVVTAGLDCVGLTCVGVSAADFPVLLISLEPDNMFPLLPSDYIECSAYRECLIRFQQSSKYWILGDAFIEAYYTHFDKENLRVGFACGGNCSGGSWHGTGGYLVLTYDEPAWKRVAFVYAIFVLMIAALMSLINGVWKLGARQSSRRSRRLARKEKDYVHPYRPILNKNDPEDSFDIFQ